MRAVVIDETGGPEVLRLEEVDRPEPADGEVLVQLHAASVNPVDWKQRRQTPPDQLPKILGRDFSGTTTDGDEVFGVAASGTYAEFAAASEGTIAAKPPGLSHERAAAIPIAGMTAWQALFDRGRLESGQTVLIAGAAGGVGHFAVQFAKIAGARVIGTGSAGNRDFVRDLGADEYVDYAQQDVAEAVSGADLAFDTVGGDVTASLVPTLREGGLLVTIAGAPPEEEAAARGARAELVVSSPDPAQLTRIAELVESGDVLVQLAEVLPLAEVRRAHELSESGHTRGKIVLMIPG
jgi:NADPH:quinone reductase-like Zn-dependent oxidoreductase